MPSSTISLNHAVDVGALMQSRRRSVGAIAAWILLRGYKGLCRCGLNRQYCTGIEDQAAKVRRRFQAREARGSGELTLLDGSIHR